MFLCLIKGWRGDVLNYRTRFVGISIFYCPDSNICLWTCSDLKVTGMVNASVVFSSLV